jgi:hypothetical protein
MNDLTGKRFGWLVAIKEAGRTKSRNLLWLCHCDCGSEVVVTSAHLSSGQTRSCGCFRRKASSIRSVRHGMEGTPVYRAWAAMKERCSNPNHRFYGHYGGRGIVVCDRWLMFENFLQDMGIPGEGMTLERKNNDEGYCLDNCKWASWKEQANNRRSSHIMSYGGKTKTLQQWADKFALPRWSLERKIKRLGYDAAMEELCQSLA